MFGDVTSENDLTGPERQATSVPQVHLQEETTQVQVLETSFEEPLNHCHQYHRIDCGFHFSFELTLI